MRLENNAKIKGNRFIYPGQKINKDIIAQRLVYVELFNNNEKSYLFVRPVKTFQVPREKGFDLEYVFFPKEYKKNIKLKTIKRIFIKNWENIKTHNSITLLKTFLTIKLLNTDENLTAQVDFIPDNLNGLTSKLKLSLFEICKSQNNNLLNNNKAIKINQTLNVKPGQFVTKFTCLAESQILIQRSGTLVSAKDNVNSKALLILKDNDIKKVTINETTSVLVQSGDLVRVGTPLTTTLNSPYSGQIYKINENNISIRLGRPYLISEGTILRVEEGDLVQQSDILATLVYDKLKTVDIVQGLPKVEEILEARKIKNESILAPTTGQITLRKGKVEIFETEGNITTLEVNTKTKIKYNNGEHINVSEPLTDGAISPYDKLNILFSYYKEKLPVHEACKKSFKTLQLFLVSEVQRTYMTQGVEISDKHIEIIVKQMTSKVQIEDSGDTILLPGEIINLSQAELASNASKTLNECPPFYSPILLGLTKASLNSDSFISAASFQETTRVLTEAAIEGKKDWLNGLKENVIIGRLIPAGTGFNSYTNRKIDHPVKNWSRQLKQKENVKENILDVRLQ
jgi:DNA-directed RNA polymerase subunit beta'